MNEIKINLNININVDSNARSVLQKAKFYYLETLELSEVPLSSQVRYEGRRVPDITKCPGFFDRLLVFKYWRIGHIRVYIRRTRYDHFTRRNTLSAMPAPVVRIIEDSREMSSEKASRHADAKEIKINPCEYSLIADFSCRVDDSIGSYSERPDTPTDSWSERNVRVSDNYMGYHLQIRDRLHPIIDTTKYDLYTELTIHYL